jgi:S-disulfanyl-L-cysteine oxidoreductase SoxD
MRCRLSARALAIALSWLAIATGGCEWPWRHDMVDQPSRTISSSARSPAVGALPLDGEVALPADTAEGQLQDPISPDAPIDTGRSLYRSYCVPCHGASGENDGPVSKYFAPMRPLDSPEVQQHADGWLFATITNGTDKMPSYRFELTPDERWQVVHFMRSVMRGAADEP